MHPKISLVRWTYHSRNSYNFGIIGLTHKVPGMELKYSYCYSSYMNCYWGLCTVKFLTVTSGNRIELFNISMGLSQ